MPLLLVAQQIIPALGHDYDIVTTAPTCTEHGYTTYTCHCTDTYVADYVSALGHTEVIDNVVAPTCTESGLTAGVKCSVCEVILEEQDVVPALGHTPGVEADCTNAQNCTVCGAELAAALGHTEVMLPAVAPTCTESGLGDYSYCSECGEVFTEREIIPATGHDYALERVSPTCDINGYTKYTCHCGNNYSYTIPAYGHDFGEWETIDEPTATEDGLRVRRCDCGEEEFEDIPALGDDAIDGEEEHSCGNVSGWTKFWRAIGNFFRRLFGQPAKCPCGKTTIE